jgi:programmed cell death 8 (apoptosis-inducing factor)
MMTIFNFFYSLFFLEDEFYVPAQTLNQNPNGGVAVVTGKRVTQVDIQNQTIRLDNNWEIAYDKCLIATGGKPKNLGVFESEWAKLKDKVTLFRNVSFFKNQKFIQGFHIDIFFNL